MAEDGDVETPEKKKTGQPTELKPEAKPGIVYLSRIPPFMSVKKIRQILSVHGEIGRIFLQPDDKTPKHKKSRLFTEGWIEFTHKRIAKRVATMLNNTQIGGKRRSRWFDEIWNVKYLSRFKWGHLNERLAYERAVHQQRLRTEISQAKRETNFYIQNVEKGQILKKVEKREKAKGGELKQRNWEFKQTETEEEILSRKRKRDGEETGSPSKVKKGKGRAGVTSKKAKHKKKTKTPVDSGSAASNKNFLKTLFSGGVANDDNE